MERFDRMGTKGVQSIAVSAALIDGLVLLPEKQMAVKNASKTPQPSVLMRFETPCAIHNQRL